MDELLAVNAQKGLHIRFTSGTVLEPTRVGDRASDAPPEAANGRVERGPFHTVNVYRNTIWADGLVLASWRGDRWAVLNEEGEEEPGAAELSEFLVYFSPSS